jgi:hypothetical protein
MILTQISLAVRSSRGGDLALKGSYGKPWAVALDGKTSERGSA